LKAKQVRWSKSNRIDLGLALLAIVRKPDEELTLEDIAAWCDCPASTIQRIEQRALKEAWWHPQNPRFRRAILEEMKAHTPPGKAAKPFKYRQQYGLIVVCENESDQRRKFEQLKKRGLTVRVVTV
jgi:hypothetical protein